MTCIWCQNLTKNNGVMLHRVDHVRHGKLSPLRTGAGDGLWKYLACLLLAPRRETIMCSKAIRHEALGGASPLGLLTTNQSPRRQP